MEKIYSDAVLKPKDDESKKAFLTWAYMEKVAKLRYTGELEQTVWISAFHNEIRTRLKMPNKIFSFFINKDNTEAVIFTFPKEPDGNKYNPVFDEEQKNIYILIE